MPDRYGPRGVFAIMIPLQNANMQPEYEMMRPEGVSNQIFRFTLAQHDKAPDAMVSAIGGALGCWPDVVIAGNSVEMRLWTPPEHAEYTARLQAEIGDARLVTATDATIGALRTIGAKRIAVMSPMHDKYSQSARDYYTSVGFDVPYHCGLQVQKPEDIIRVGPKEAIEAFRKLDHDDVDTFLHVGGALGIVDHLDEFEAELGRPVISSNAATYWYALRKHGIQDPMPGFGQLLMRTEIDE